MPTMLLRVAVAAMALSLAVGPVAACSNDSEKPQQSTTSTPPQVEHGAYEKCLAEHGVSSPTQGPPPGPAPESTSAAPPPGVDQQTWDHAMSSCASLRPSAPGPAG